MMRGLRAPGHAPVILATGAATVMSGAAIAPGLAEIHAALGSADASPALARFALVLPAIVAMLAAPTIGRRAAAFDPRRVIAVSLGLIAISGSAAAFAASYAGLLLARAALGLAIAAALSAATAAIARRYEGPARQTMMSAQIAANTLSGVVFIVTGGFLAAFDWRLACALYLLALPVAAAAWRLDWGAADGPAPGQRAPARARDETLPLIAIFCGMGAFYLLPSQVPFLPGVATGPAAGGLVIGAGTLASAVAALLSGWVVAQLDRRGTILAGFALIALGCLEMALAPNAVAGMVAAMLAGAGFGLVVPTASLMVLDTAAPSERGARSGRIAAALSGGQVLAMAHATAADFVGGPTAPFWTVTVLLSAALLSRTAAMMRADRVLP